ncbi:MAG: Tol-Pal system beta propeller repeat protein TolB [Alphaproteobacteria bacterium]
MNLTITANRAPRPPRGLSRALRRIALAAGVAVASAVALGPAPAHAELRLDITRGQVEPMPIAIVSFVGETGDEAGVGRDVADVVTADLEGSGLFAPVDPRAFVQAPETLNAGPRFGDWRTINAQALVHGAVARQPDGRLRVEFRLWDVYAEQQMAGFAYHTQPQNWRRVAHIIADAIYKRITGEQGYFDTRIVYVAETGPAQNRTKRLAIMDQDGANQRFLTGGENLVLTPRFSPTAQEITYLAYDESGPRVHMLNIDTGQREVLGRYGGMTFAPRFSPDGDAVIFSMSRDGNSDIYSMDLRTRQTRRLTEHPAIDTSPSYSPDGRQIVFNSDRGGSQQLYVMDGTGGNVRRISHGDGRYATPVWSPRGDQIAFTKMHQGRFFIGVMRPDGSGERLLSESYQQEGPTWAPNGRVLMFFRTAPSDSRGGGGGSRLYRVDITGSVLREVATTTDASDPAWSPLPP